MEETKIILLPRGGGKTTAAIERSARTGDVIITDTVQRANTLFQIAYRNGTPIPRPMTFRDLTVKTAAMRGISDKNLIIDDADYLLQNIARPNKITMITMTLPNKSTTNKNNIICPLGFRTDINPDVCAECVKYEECPQPLHSGLSMWMILPGIAAIATTVYVLLWIFSLIIDWVGL